MSNKTIAKFFRFVILIAVASATGCSFLASQGSTQPEFDRDGSPYEAPVIRGRIESRAIKESSGLAASKCQPGVLWTHNDSGDKAIIFAVDPAGKDLGSWAVTNAENRDWEDIAAFKTENGECFIYIGDIGNNDSKRDRTTVYRVKEPTARTAVGGGREASRTEAAEIINVEYPGPRPDAETLMVHPRTGDIYIVTKRVDGPATVYKVTPEFGKSVTAAKVAEIRVPSVPNGLLSGGDISPDGLRVALCDNVAGYELVLPSGSANFDDIWLQKPLKFDAGDRKNGESIAYSHTGDSILAGSEGKNSPIFELKRRN